MSRWIEHMGPRNVIDSLADRRMANTKRWLIASPGTELISRDRASLNAKAATNAATGTVQVIDSYMFAEQAASPYM